MARNPKQDANLKPIKKGELSKEEAKRRGSNGGKKSGETRRKNREAREAARYVLNLAAKGTLKDNLQLLGYEEEVNSNMDALYARLFTMAMGGNLEALNLLMKYAGQDPKENREERESLEAAKRRAAELEAKLTALGNSPENATMALNMGDEDGHNDVVIYIPQMMTDEECKVKEETPAEEDGSDQ